jgi:hypothetical protein
MAAAIGASVALAGCYHTVYHFDAPKTGRSVRYDGSWRLALIAGALELSEPVALGGACPGGQIAEITEVSTFGNVVVSLLINAITLEFPLVHFRSVTVDCGPPTPAAPAAGSGPAPAPEPASPEPPSSTTR